MLAKGPKAECIPNFCKGAFFVVAEWVNRNPTQVDFCGIDIATSTTPPKSKKVKGMTLRHCPLAGGSVAGRRGARERDNGQATSRARKHTGDV